MRIRMLALVLIALASPAWAEYGAPYNQCQKERFDAVMAVAGQGKSIMVPVCDGDRYELGICDMDKKRCQAARKSYEAFMMGNASDQDFARQMFETTTRESAAGVYEGNVWTGSHLIRRKIPANGLEWDWERMTFDGERPPQ